MGKLLPAIRASYSLPGLLTPAKIKKRILIDGGVVNPLPFDILFNDCDITIAVDVTAYRTSKGKEYPPTFESVFTAYQIMQNSINLQKMKFIKPDIYIRPEIYDVRVFDFSKHESIFKQAETAKDNLKRKLEEKLIIEPEPVISSK
jgi:NTE family protein